MRTPRPLPDGAAERLAAMLKEAKSKADYQRIQCVWLRAALGLGAAQIAVALGWQVGSVRQVHSDYLRQGEAVENQLLTALATWEADAPQGASLPGFDWIKSTPLNAH